MATTLLDLPDELILHIAELLGRREQYGIRLIAKRIDHCISPILFATVYCYGPNVHGAARDAMFSENLSHGKELVFSRCTKKMVFFIYKFYPLNLQLPWLQLMNHLIPTLTNLHTLEWTYWPPKHPVSDLVMNAFNAFGSLPSLRELKILVVVTYPFPAFNFKSFSNLCSLSIIWELKVNVNRDFISDVADLLGRCPDLECFTFCIPRPYYPPDAPFLAHIFAGLPSNTRLKLRLLDVTGLHVSADDFRVHLCLPPLKILRLMFNRESDSPYQNYQICQLLLDNSTDLDEFAIDTTHPTSVLDYLSSYSGLHHLEFKSRYSGADAPDSVHRFFSSVLPLHTSTLRHLQLGWSIDTPWTRLIAPEDIAQIKRCQQLTVLCCYITVSTGPTECTDKVVLMWLETAIKLPRLQYLNLYPTRRFQPPLRNGEFHFDLATSRERAIEGTIEEFTQAVVDKFTADLPVPFRITVASPNDGP